MARITLIFRLALNWFTAFSSVQASKRLIFCPDRPMKPLPPTTFLRKNRYPESPSSRGSQILTPHAYNTRATMHGRPLFFVLPPVAGSVLTIMPIGRRPLFLRWSWRVVPSLLWRRKRLAPALLLELLRLLRLWRLPGLHRSLLTPALR